MTGIISMDFVAGTLETFLQQRRTYLITLQFENTLMALYKIEANNILEIESFFFSGLFNSVILYNFDDEPEIINCSTVCRIQDIKVLEHEEELNYYGNGV